MTCPAREALPRSARCTISRTSPAADHRHRRYRGGIWEENDEYHQKVLRELIRVKGLKKATMEVEPGDAVIWAANLLHGGEPIRRQGSTRHSQVTHYYFEGCSYYTPSLSNPPLGMYHRPDRRDIRTGEPIAHMFDEIALPHRAS